TVEDADPNNRSEQGQDPNTRPAAEILVATRPATSPAGVGDHADSPRRGEQVNKTNKNMSSTTPSWFCGVLPDQPPLPTSAMNYSSARPAKDKEPELQHELHRPQIATLDSRARSCWGAASNCAEQEPRAQSSPVTGRRDHKSSHNKRSQSPNELGKNRRDIDFNNALTSEQKQHAERIREKREIQARPSTSPTIAL
ncbi:unnamed protein product, partial [Amoebophrya sp. A120]